MSKKSEIKELAESMSLLTECSHCKQKINSKAPFCQYCGTKQKILANKKNCFCIYCGKEIGVNSSFCSFCGKSQKEIVIPVKPKITEKKIKDKKIDRKIVNEDVAKAGFDAKETAKLLETKYLGY